MRKAFTGLATLLVLLVVAQFVFAAVGGFSTATREESYRSHHALGYVIFLVPLVMASLAALARMPGRLIGWPALVAGLTGIQVPIAELARSSGDSGTVGLLISGLHAVNGLAILALTAMILRSARTRSAGVMAGP